MESVNVVQNTRRVLTRGIFTQSRRSPTRYKTANGTELEMSREKSSMARLPWTRPTVTVSTHGYLRQSTY